jgi:hypothetical protein
MHAQKHQNFMPNSLPPNTERVGFSVVVKMGLLLTGGIDDPSDGLFNRIIEGDSKEF